MANTTETYDVSHDRCLYSLYRMGFESAGVDYAASRINISNYWSDDRELCHMDGSREVRAKKDGQMISYMLKYLKRIWCAVLNKKCHDECDCTVKKEPYDGL